MPPGAEILAENKKALTYPISAYASFLPVTRHGPQQTIADLSLQLEHLRADLARARELQAQPGQAGDGSPAPAAAAATPSGLSA